MDDTRYKTFWRRFGAGIIDGFVLVPAMIIAIPLLMAAIATENAVLFLLAAAFMSSVGIVYSVLMHANGGQTVGKMATGVVVVDNRTHGRITFAQALRRDSGQIFFSATGLIVLAWNLPDLGDLERGQTDGGDPLGALNGWANMLWFLAEMVSIWTNERRRASTTTSPGPS
jgi:uncharacterized RDD family membrane protein YckC